MRVKTKMNEIKHKKLGKFTTRLIKPYNEKQAYIYTSRRARKGLPELLVEISTYSLSKPFTKHSLYTYQPNVLTWWVAHFFMLGSSLFAAGGFMLLYFESNFSNLDINLTFFIGSIFFTLAAYGQLLEVINADITNKVYLNRKESPWLWWEYRPGNLGYLASITQLVGAILFNFNTFDAFYTGLSALAEDVIIWIPNMLGSILFITASFFAWLEVYQDKYIKSFYSVTWWIIWINILGSVFFQLSAILSYVDIASGELFDGINSLKHTVYGAICFFIASYLLVVEMAEDEQDKKSNS